MDQLKVAIVDYEAGNLRSVQKAIEACGSIAKITTDVEDINSCDGIILPGQGASDSRSGRQAVAPLLQDVRPVQLGND